MTTPRVNEYIDLPTTMDPHVRRAVIEVLRRHAIQINLATGIDAQTVTGDTTVATRLVLADAASGTLACTLVPAASFVDRTISIKKVDITANTVRIVPQAGETIDNTATAVITTALTSVQVVSDGANWWIV